MAKAEFWQRGEALDYTNTTTATIPANTIVKIGDHIGVTGTDIEPNKVGSLHVGGIWEIPKTGTKKIDMGATVYCNRQYRSRLRSSIRNRRGHQDSGQAGWLIGFSPSPTFRSALPSTSPVISSRQTARRTPLHGLRPELPCGCRRTTTRPAAWWPAR